MARPSSDPPIARVPGRNPGTARTHVTDGFCSLTTEYQSRESSPFRSARIAEGKPRPDPVKYESDFRRGNTAALLRHRVDVAGVCDRHHFRRGNTAALLRPHVDDEDLFGAEHISAVATRRLYCGCWVCTTPSGGLRFPPWQHGGSIAATPSGPGPIRPQVISAVATRRLYWCRSQQGRVLLARRPTIGAPPHEEERCSSPTPGWAGGACRSPRRRRSGRSSRREGR